MLRLVSVRAVVALFALVLAGWTGLPAGAADVCTTLTRLGDQPAGCISDARAYTEAKTGMLLLYPSTWSTRGYTQGPARTVTLIAPTGGTFSVDVFDFRNLKSVADEMQDIRDRRAQDKTGPNTDGPVSDLKIGGEPAQTFTTRIEGKNGAPLLEQVWVVNHHGTEVLIQAFIDPARTAPIEAIIDSILFF